VPFIDLPPAPVRPDHVAPRIFYRDRGAGPAVLLLHGGWGHEAYPFGEAAAALEDRHRVVVPDRVGYGRSGRLAALPEDFHRRMAEETVLVMDALRIERAALWGHSDGAVVAAWTAILFPRRVRALALEALHFRAAKVSSTEFFRTAVEEPERFGDAVVRALAEDHAAEQWRGVLAAGGRAWLRIVEEGRRGRADLYGGRFGEIAAPTLLLHGRRDPRTEPGEIDDALAALPRARVTWFDAGHSPHTGRTSAEACVDAARRFLDETRDG
jgi:pimeloyl-ACP methyl ester carboxylesterase